MPFRRWRRGSASSGSPRPPACFSAAYLLRRLFLEDGDARTPEHPATVVACICVFLAAATSPTADAARTETGSYLPGIILIGISCGEGPHGWVPDEEPQDPLDLGWLWSGEPECAPADAYNAYREEQGKERHAVGLGSYAFPIESTDAGTSAYVATDDAHFGSMTYQYLVARAIEPEDDAVSEGCGPRSLTIPENPEMHWQSSWPSAYVPMWAWLDEIGVDSDLSLCFSSYGEISGTYGP